MPDYDFQEIETRWQQKWAESGAFEVSEDPKRPKFYCLEMLPYPSGDIHVGHVRNYCITDVISRCKTMRGMNVMHPIGWDALGLPAENAAIKKGVHPEAWTRANIASMKRQLQRLGFSYPWSREIATCDASYYRWNQWFFLRMLEKGIAYRAKAPGQLVPVVPHRARQRAGRGRALLALQERRSSSATWSSGSSGSPPTRTPCSTTWPQLPTWPERVLQQQRNWVGKSHGAEVDFPVEGFPSDPHLHDARRHDLRCDLHGARTRAPDGRRPARRPSRRGRAQGEDRAPARAGPPRAPRGEGRKGRRLHRPPRDEPVHERKDPDLGRQLRADGLRHGRDHVGAGARRARLRVRPQVRARGAGRDPARGRDARRPDARGRLRRAGHGREQRRVRRPGGRGRDPAHGRLGRDRRGSARRRPRTGSRTG